MKVLNEQTVEQILTYVDHHFDRLERIAKAVEEGVQNEEYLRLKGAIPLDGTGAGQAQLPVPVGFDYIMQRITTTTSAGGLCEIFENSTSPSDLLEEIAAPNRYSDAFSNNIFVPGGSTVVLNFTGAGVNGQATYNIQVKRIKSTVKTVEPNLFAGGDA